MGTTELSNKLGLSKSTVSFLVKKGMPVNSVSAAQAWREANAKPRAKRGHAGTVPPVPHPAEASAPLPDAHPPSRDTAGPDAEEANNDPRQSLRRARRAELVGYNELLKCQKNGSSVEDFRKANSVYVSGRNNRVKAEKDFKEHQRQESILLYFDEARDITSRPHLAAKNMLDGGAKTLAPRLHGQPQKAIEKTLAEFFDTLMSVIRKGI